MTRLTNNGCSRRKRNRPRYRNPSRSRRSFVRWRREYVAYGGLPAAAAELTRGLSRIISAKVAAGKIFSNNCCGVYDEAYDGSVLRNVWIDAGYQNANIDKPVDMEADVWGITGGFDIQADAHNKLGVFTAYRRGQYDLSGKGTYYNSTLGSRIDIDSWLGGLYYRFDKNRLYVMSTVFGGIQKADVKTDDGTIKTDTDADQFGGSLETGYVYGLGKTLTLEPSLGISYAHINYGDIHDRAGTTAAYDNLNYFEAEAGIKLEKTFYYDEGTAKVYIRPSVIQTFGDSGDVRIDSLRPTNSLRNQTLGRIELGGRYGFGNRLSFYGWTPLHLRQFVRRRGFRHRVELRLVTGKILHLQIRSSKKLPDPAGSFFIARVIA